MPGEDVGVVQGELRTHAGSVERVADGVEQGRSAGSTVQMGRDAYGQLCQVIPSLLDPIQQMGIDAMQEAIDALHSTADRLRTAAQEYTGTDDAAAADLFRAGPGGTSPAG